jgi:hypothetical protein
VFRVTIAVLALTSLVSVAEAQPQHRLGRVWIEAGPSFDRTSYRSNAAEGFAIAGGADVGRTFALTLRSEVEHYSRPGSWSNVVMAGVGGPDTLRMEGGGNKTVLTFAAGFRITIPASVRFEPFLEGALGFSSTSYDSRRWVDANTGAVVYPSQRTEWSGWLGEAGFGIRTRRTTRFDWTLGARWRGYSQLFEGSSGASAQVMLGVMTL